MLWPHTKTPDESLGLHYVLLVLAQDKFLQLDTTSFLQKPNMSYQLKCKDLHFAAKGHYYNLLPGLITPPYIEELQRPHSSDKQILQTPAHAGTNLINFTYTKLTALPSSKI